VFDPQEDDSGNVNYLIPQPTQKQAEGLEADGSRHPDANLITNSNEGCIPIIVHNGLMDLLFLMTHFHHPILPETWQEAKALVHSFFPKVCDTKYLAEECCPISYHSTKLEDMFNFWESEDQLSQHVQLASEFKDRYKLGSTAGLSNSATVPPPQGRAAVQTSTNERASGAHEAGKKSSSINQSLSLSLLILYFKSWPYKYFKILSLL
jgi:hypothetical protein